jgi:hypothetical protein
MYRLLSSAACVILLSSTVAVSKQGASGSNDLQRAGDSKEEEKETTFGWNLKRHLTLLQRSI